MLDKLPVELLEQIIGNGQLEKRDLASLALVGKGSLLRLARKRLYRTFHLRLESRLMAPFASVMTAVAQPSRQQLEQLKNPHLARLVVKLKVDWVQTPTAQATKESGPLWQVALLCRNLETIVCQDCSPQFAVALLHDPAPQLRNLRTITLDNDTWQLLAQLKNLRQLECMVPQTQTKLTRMANTRYGLDYSHLGPLPPLYDLFLSSLRRLRVSLDDKVYDLSSLSHLRCVIIEVTLPRVWSPSAFQPILSFTLSSCASLETLVLHHTSSDRRWLDFVEGTAFLNSIPKRVTRLYGLPALDEKKIASLHNRMSNLSTVGLAALQTDNFTVARDVWKLQRVFLDKNSPHPSDLDECVRVFDTVEVGIMQKDWFSSAKSTALRHVLDHIQGLGQDHLSGDCHGFIPRATALVEWWTPGLADPRDAIGTPPLLAHLSEVCEAHSIRLTRVSSELYDNA
ncbi:hypothetical protein JCM10207_000291 [Rhodosporidiobolus poonsookiae]